MKLLHFIAKRTPLTSRHIPRQSCLCSLYAHRTCDRDIKTLNEAISLYREALALHPAPSPDRHGLLNNLAYALHCLYCDNGDIRTLNESISMSREGLMLCPALGPLRCAVLGILADALLSRFEESQEVEVLDEAISLRRELLVLRPLETDAGYILFNAFWCFWRSGKKLLGTTKILVKLRICGQSW